MTQAIIFGRFCPLHNAHLALIHATLHLGHDLTIGLFTHTDDPISTEQRLDWLSRYGRVEVIDVADRDTPYASIDVARFADIDLVAGGNIAAIDIARKLSAEHFMWDPAREAMQIDADEVLANPAKHWDEMPKFVRIHCQKRIGFVGPESVGKSFFAREMAKRFGGPHVPEYVVHMKNTAPKVIILARN